MLEQYITQIREEIDNNRLVLPVLPEIALEARRLCSDPTVGAKSLTDLINREPSMVARILKVANSAAVRGGNAITDITQAIVRLGNSLVSSLVTSMSLVPIFQTKHPTIQRLLRNEWEHSIHVGSIAYVLAKHRRISQPELALLAGQLHDIGKLPILSQLAQWPALLKSESMIDKVANHYHIEVGGHILKTWQLPSEVVNAALRHHVFPNNEHQTAPLNDIIRIADIHSHRHCDGYQQQALPAAETLKRLDYDPEAGLSDIEEKEIEHMHQSFLH